MIIQKQYEIQGGEPPYTYSVIGNGTAVTNSPAQDNLIDFTFDFETGNQQVTIAGYDANSCTFIQEFLLGDPCEQLILTGIQRNGFTLVAQANTLDNCNINYQWEYDTTAFDAIQTDNQLIIEPLVNTGGYIFTVTVTDCNGCIKTASREIFLNNEGLVNDQVIAQLQSNGTHKALVSLPNNGNNIDWTTLKFLNASNFTTTNVGNQVTLTTNLGVTQELEYQVKTVDGILLNKAKLTIEIPDTEVLTFPNKVFVVESGTIETDITTANSYYGGQPDFTQVTILDDPQNNATYNEGVITHSSPTNFEDEVIRFRVKDQDGNWSNIATYTFVEQEGDYVVPDIAALITCGNTLTLNLIEESTITEQTSDAQIQANTLTATQSGTVYLQATNNNTQQDNYTLQICKECLDPVSVTTCEDSINLWQQIEDVAQPDGTWSGQAIVPTSFDDDLVTQSGTLTYTYTFTPLLQDEDYQCPDQTIDVTVTKVATTFTTGNNCDTAIALRANVQGVYPYTANTTDDFLFDCTNALTGTATPYSKQYTKWYQLTIVPPANPQLTDIKIDVIVDSSQYQNPINNPSLALYSACGTIIKSQEFQSPNYIIQSHQVLNTEPFNLLVEVGANNKGLFDLVINTKEI